MSEISDIVNKVNMLDSQISKAFQEGDADKATMKAKLKELSEGLAGLSKVTERAKDLNDPCHLFGNKSVRNDFMDFLVSGPLQKIKSLNPGKSAYGEEWQARERAYTKDKAQDLYQSVNGGAPAPATPGSNGSGGYLVPTTVDTVLWQLILQGFEARKLLTVREVVGNFALPVATNQAKSYFVGADNSTMSETDFAGGVSGQQPFQPNVTVSPATIGAYMNVSSKLLYNSAVDLSTYVAQNLAVSAGLLEDLMTIWGDGTSTWGLQTGLFTAANTAGQVITTSTTSGNTLIPLDDATIASGHAKFSIDDLVNMRVKAQESVDGNGCYFMQREVWAYFCALKADNGSYGSLLYYLNPYTQGRVTPQGMAVGDINGVPVILWNRLSTGKYVNGAIFSGTAGTSPAGDWGQVAMTNNSVYPCVIYGDLKKAATLVFNRNMFIDVDRSIRFLQGEYTWRIIEDVGVGVQLPKALSILAVTAIGS